MVKKKESEKAQFLGEYTLIIAISIFSIIAMTFFVQRGISARINSARSYALTKLDSEIKQVHFLREGKMYPQVIAEYEPYYVEKITNTDSKTDTEVFLNGEIGSYVREATSEMDMNATSTEGFARDDDYGN